MGECPRCGRSLGQGGKCVACGRERLGGATALLGTPGEASQGETVPAEAPRARAVATTHVLGSPVLPTPQPPAEAPVGAAPTGAIQRPAAPEPIAEPAPEPEPAARREPRAAPLKGLRAARVKIAPPQQRRAGASEPPNENPARRDVTIDPAAWLPRSRRWPAALAVLGTAALTAGVALWLWSARAPALGVEVTLDADGAQWLVVKCSSCATGARVGLTEPSTAFDDGRARLALRPALAPGPQPVQLLLQEARGSTREIEAQVNPPGRLSPDLGSLSLDRPALGIRVEAAPGVAVVLDGRPVILDDVGRGTHTLSPGRAFDGAAPKRERVERRVPFTFTVPGREPMRGRFPLFVDVAPLQLEAPGDSIVIDTDGFMLAGATLLGASVQVENHSLTVDREGRFAQRMSVSSIGERTIVVRARAPGLAPRSVRIRVRRVANLQDAARQCPVIAESEWAAVLGDAERARGRRLGVTGRVAEVRFEGHRSELELELTAECGGRPCRVRVHHGATVGAAVGDTVTACGSLAVTGGAANLVAELVTPVGEALK